ncbi:hypothetical protein LSH36_174g02023 [Paralvinella palmiformis]|uniref:G-protein coupled receptors family 1 profile domain-containing protein n=1 Tax=Paralvinella palmiformis TaxID=53620 RepID=A0AAD9JT82_9ANNE|nr:hypothetical protein LSH36_174g02023 [Paralvinella palmiformis]
MANKYLFSNNPFQVNINIAIMANISNITEKIGQEDPIVYKESIFANNIWIYGSGVIIVFGTIGNLLSGLVMMRKSLQRHTTSLYLTVLAVVDTAVLYTGLLRYWIRALYGLDIRTLSVAGCKLHIFLVYFLVHFEAWILVWVAVERLVAIFVPHRAKDLFTKKSAAIQLIVTATALMILNAHFFWTETIVDTYCFPSDTKYEYFRNVVWSWIDFVVASLAPFVLMISINVAIIVRLVYLRKRHNLNARADDKTRMTTMTTILITVSCMFFITTAPITIYIGTQKHWRSKAETDRDEAKIELVWASVNMAAYTNCATNFILYCLSGPSFRRELVKMLHLDRWLNKVQPIDHSTVSTILGTIRTN